MTQKYFLERDRFQPAYAKLWKSGELKRRAESALAVLSDCSLCPRACHADRLGKDLGTCQIGRTVRVSSYGPHFGEEDCLRGRYGSGTVFFARCNLLCVFCQNYEVSWRGEGSLETAEELAAIFLELQRRSCHNINLVTPSHVVPQVLEALVVAAEQGLRLPIVYNTSAYDSLEALQLLDGVVDIYMPDFKYWSSDAARRYSNAEDYPEVARRAIREMHRQVGPLMFDEQGLALRGVLLRHLVMPDSLAGTPHIMRWIAEELDRDTYVNLMSQYHPAGQVSGMLCAEINRTVARREIDQAYSAAVACGLHRIEGGFARPRPR